MSAQGDVALLSTKLCLTSPFLFEFFKSVFVQKSFKKVKNI